jgi:DNA-directed RNA polymerase subunit M/transcription elongation factor TFIIS
MKIYFCQKCGNLLQKKYMEKVEINGRIFFKCKRCGNLNEPPDKKNKNDVINAESESVDKNISR